jgi:putative ABC transport system permease protein
MLKDAERIGVDFTIAGRPAVTRGDEPRAMFSAISPDYLHVMQIPLLRGRELSEKDVETSPWVVVINVAMARKYWPNQDPIGQVITLDTQALRSEERPREIVGVVGNVRQFQLGTDPFPEMYAPYPQQAHHCTPAATETRLHKSLVLRTSSESKGFIDSVRRAVTEIDKDSPVFGITTVQETISKSANLERFYTQLLGGFALVALLLAAIGIYGVISYSVNERRHEIGLRMALGAQSTQVLRLVLKEGLILSVAGVVDRPRGFIRCHSRALQLPLRRAAARSAHLNFGLAFSRWHHHIGNIYTSLSGHEGRSHGDAPPRVETPVAHALLRAAFTLV